MFQAMIKWVYSEKQYVDTAKSEFASVADGWLVAYAAVNRSIVVTHEDYAPDARRSVKIPNICVEFDVEYMNTFEMLTQLGEKFVRSTKRKKSKK